MVDLIGHSRLTQTKGLANMHFESVSYNDILMNEEVESGQVSESLLSRKLGKMHVDLDPDSLSSTFFLHHPPPHP